MTGSKNLSNSAHLVFAAASKKWQDFFKSRDYVVNDDSKLR